MVFWNFCGFQLLLLKNLNFCFSGYWNASNDVMLTADVCLNRPDFLNLQTCPAPIDMAQRSPNTFFRGYKPRGSLARALHDKVVQDQYLSQIDKNEVSSPNNLACLREISSPMKVPMKNSRSKHWFII